MLFVAVIQLGYIVRRYLLPAVIAVHGDILCAKLPDGLVGQDIAIILDGYGSVRHAQGIFHIAFDLQLVAAKGKGEPAHTVVAQDDPAVRVSKADAHRQLIRCFLNGERRELVLFTAVFPRQSNGKVNCRKENGSGKDQPRCAQQKCVPDIIGICLGNGEQQRDHHRHNRQTQQAAHRLIAAKKLIDKQPDFKDNFHKHDKRQHGLPKFRKGRKCTHFPSPSFASNTRRWYSSSSSFSQRIPSPLTKAERSALQHTFSDKRKPSAFMRLTCMPVKFKISASITDS